ncbi:DUF374 domain-containing protein [Candidatus Poribacteria bacterium]|nr:DUF374 domain-containing protein [Candidatus Poribacteria bacterium]
MIKPEREKRFKRLSKLGKWLAVWLVPPLYNSYMWVVYHTSRKTYIDIPKLWEMTARGENALGAVWHQDGFISPFCHRGHDILTMVSFSSLGDVLTEIFRKCHFIPVRGGSARGGKEALAEIINYIRTHRGVLCGIAVDGSRGPARKARFGLLLIAQETGCPIYPMRAWARWKLFAPTWDKTLIPLPFNHLLFVLGPPLHVPSDADRTTLESFRSELEKRLNDLVDRSERFFHERR